MRKEKHNIISKSIIQKKKSKNRKMEKMKKWNECCYNEGLNEREHLHKVGKQDAVDVSGGRGGGGGGGERREGATEVVAREPWLWVRPETTILLQIQQMGVIHSTVHGSSLDSEMEIDRSIRWRFWTAKFCFWIVESSWFLRTVGDLILNYFWARFLSKNQKRVKKDNK